MPVFILRKLAFLSFAGVLSVSAGAAPALPSLGADLGELTVSGISSGAYMAVQFQVAHAKLVRGAGIIAGGPYDCARGSTWRALIACRSPASWAPLPTLAELRQNAETQWRSERIDPLTDLRDDRVWLFSGGKDRQVKTVVMEQLAAFYREWIPAEAIRFVKNPDAVHAMISVADPQANACSSSDSPYINRCGDFDMAGEMLKHLLGDLQAPTSPPNGEVLRFDQRPFVDGKAIDAGLADEAYVYVPRACHEASCRIHVVFHGCRQSATNIERRFVDGAGYNRWADSNRLVVLYPQTVPRYGLTIGSWTWLNNPFACWDWWGYSGSHYATRDGRQIKAVRAMIARLAEARRP